MDECISDSPLTEAVCVSKNVADAEAKTDNESWMLNVGFNSDRETKEAEVDAEHESVVTSGSGRFEDC